MIEVVNINNVTSTVDSEVTCTATFNVDNIQDDEKAQIRWNINGKEVPENNGKIEITHDLKEEKVRDVMFKAYVDGTPENAAILTLSNDVESEVKKMDSIENEEDL